MGTRMPTVEAPRIVTAQHLIRALPAAAHRTRPERAQVIPAPMARVRRTPSTEARATRTRTAAQLRAKPATARHTPRPTERRQLPPPTIRPNVSGGGTYYLCGNTWFSPAYGANGVYYHVVPAP